MSKWQGVYDNAKSIDSIKSMNQYQIDFTESYDDSDIVPSDFSVLTYNIWGLSINSDLQRLFSLRKHMLESTIRNCNADFICLQEMSDFSYDQLKDLIHEYKYASEKPYVKQISRKRNADVYFMSKYKPSNITVYGLPGILCYNNSMIVAEYQNLVIFNVYLQSGTKKSPGQSESWQQFSECRLHLLSVIYNIVSTYNNKNIVICGDFNFDLDGALDEWPELKIINTLKSDGFIDTFKFINPHQNGYTEDTDHNFLRWNLKLIDKKYKFDAIFHKFTTPVTIVSSKLIGFDVSYLDAENSKWFMDTFSDANGDYNKLKQVIKSYDGNNLIPINASDHFGVLTVFKSDNK